MSKDDIIRHEVFPPVAIGGQEAGVFSEQIAMSGMMIVDIPPSLLLSSPSDISSRLNIWGRPVQVPHTLSFFPLNHSTVYLSQVGDSFA
jgi:hypothetical protein